MKKATLENQIKSLNAKLSKQTLLVTVLHEAVQLADGELAEARGLLKKHMSTDDLYEFTDKWNKARNEWYTRHGLEKKAPTVAGG